MSDLEDLASAVREIRESGRPAPLARRASFGARAGAALADLILLIFVTLAVAALVSLMGVATHGRWNDAGPFFVLSGILLYGAMDIFIAGTPGKQFIGLTIKRPDAHPAPLNRLVLRWSLKYSFLLAFSFYLGAIAVVDRIAWSATQLDLINEVLGWLQMGVWILVAVIFGGTIAVLTPARRSLHDWISGTAVYDQVELARKPAAPEKGFAVDQSMVPDKTVPREP